MSTTPEHASYVHKAGEGMLQALLEGIPDLPPGVNPNMAMLHATAAFTSFVALMITDGNKDEANKLLTFISETSKAAAASSVFVSAALAKAASGQSETHH